jgi:acyl phosphate:glycerol-3-phosphate acyltransferase
MQINPLFYLTLVVTYLIGAIPTGRFIGRYYGVKVENKGSGNIGATNIARVVGKKAGIITLLSDILKGYLAIIIASLLTEIPQSFCYPFALSVVMGHCFSLPCWKGGKGVATTLGAISAITPISALISLAFFITVYLYTKIVSLASITAVILLPLICTITNYKLPILYFLPWLGLITVIIINRHHANIVRLLKGEEQSFR